MFTLLRPIVFAMAIATAFLSPRSCPAAVVPTMPQKIVISRMRDHGNLVYVLFVDGQFEKGFLLDPKTADPSGDVRLPYKGTNPSDSLLPVGKLSLLGVPRALANKSKNGPDLAWLTEAPPGVVRVTGVIHHYPVEKSATLHLYELEKTNEGLKIALLTPDVLTPYPPEEWMLAKDSSKPYLWIALAGAVTVLLTGVVVLWILKRRGSQGGSST